MSSRIDRETGEVTITAPAYATMPVGYRLAVCGSPAVGGAYRRCFDDYIARLALSQPSNGRPWGEGVDVRPDDSALFELLEGGLVHESLVEEPRAAA